MEAPSWKLAGMGGLFAFEAILTLVLVGFGATTFAVVSGAGALLLAAALVGAWRDGEVPAWALWGLVATTLVRAVLQVPASPALFLVPAFLVPLGFAAVALGSNDPRRAAVGLLVIGACRAIYATTYATDGNPAIAAANVLGALGAVAWALAVNETGTPSASGERAAQSNLRSSAK